MMKRIVLGIALVMPFMVNADRITIIDSTDVSHEIEANSCLYGMAVDGDVLYEFIPAGVEAEHCWINREDLVHFYAQPESWSKRAAWVETARDLGGREIRTINVYQQTTTVGTYRLQRVIEVTRRAEREALLPPVGSRAPEETLTVAEIEEALHPGGVDLELAPAAWVPAEEYVAAPRVETAPQIEAAPLAAESRARYFDRIRYAIEHAASASGDMPGPAAAGEAGRRHLDIPSAPLPAHREVEPMQTATPSAVAEGSASSASAPVEEPAPRSVSIVATESVPLEHQLIYAAQIGDLPAVQAAVADGVNVNVRSYFGKTALMSAAQRGDLPMVEYLIANHAEVNAHDSILGMTALMFAVIANQFTAADYLIRHGADVDARENHGFTALMHVALSEMAPAVQYLLEQHADANLRDDGRTALDMASDPVVQELLRRAMAEREEE